MNGLPYPTLSQPELRAPAPSGAGFDDSVYQRLLRERIIFLGSDVRDDNANAICAQMLLLAAEDSEKDIWLYINSPGGSITAGMAIYDTMQYIRPSVATICIGMSASIAALLLAGGTKGKRTAPKTFSKAEAVLASGGMAATHTRSS